MRLLDLPIYDIVGFLLLLLWIGDIKLCVVPPPDLIFDDHDNVTMRLCETVLSVVKTIPNYADWL